jgi:hypothetical protein
MSCEDKVIINIINMLGSIDKQEIVPICQPVYTDDGIYSTIEEPNYGAMWEGWLFQKYDPIRSRIYELCRMVDDEDNELARKELLAEINKGGSDWLYGIKMFLNVTNEEKTEISDILYNNQINDIIVVRAILLEYSYGAFYGVCEANNGDSKYARLAELSACLVHAGLKWLRSKKLSKWDIGQYDESIAKALVWIGHLILYSTCDYASSNRVSMNTVRAMHKIVGAHFFVGMYSKKYRDDCGKNGWSDVIIDRTLAKNVVTGLINNFGSLVNIDNTFLKIVLDRVAAHISIWKGKCIDYLGSNRIVGGFINEILTPHYNAACLKLLDELHDNTLPYDKLYQRILVWMTTLTSCWSAGSSDGDEYIENSLIGAYLGVARETVGVNKLHIVKIATEFANRRLSMMQYNNRKRLEEIIYSSILRRGQCDNVSLSSLHGGEYYGARAIDGIWTLVQECVCIYNTNERYLNQKQQVAAIRIFDDCTHKNRNAENDGRSAREADVSTECVCNICAGADIIRSAGTNGITIGILQTTLWGTFLYGNLGLLNDVHDASVFGEPLLN